MHTLFTRGEVFVYSLFAKEEAFAHPIFTNARAFMSPPFTNEGALHASLWFFGDAPAGDVFMCVWFIFYYLRMPTVVVNVRTKFSGLTALFGLVGVCNVSEICTASTVAQLPATPAALTKPVADGTW